MRGGHTARRSERSRPFSSRRGLRWYSWISRSSRTGLVFPTSSPVHRAEAADQRVRRRGPGASGEARHHGLGAPRVDLNRSLAPSFYACGIGSWRSQRPSLADYVTGTGPTAGASALDAVSWTVKGWGSRGALMLDRARWKARQGQFRGMGDRCPP
jgi:hypothetical protein